MFRRIWISAGVLLFMFHTAFGQISVSINEIRVAQNDTVTIPIRIGNVTGEKIESFQFDLFFDDSVIVPVEETLTGTIAQNWGNLFVNNHNSGELRIGTFGLDYLHGEGPLVFLKFAVVGKIGDTTSVHLENFLFNNGNPETVIKDGKVSVDLIRLYVTSNVKNALFKIDTTMYKSPARIYLPANSKVIVSTDSLQYDTGDRRYLFENWSDGGPLCHSITADSMDMRLGIVFRKQYFLSLNSEYGSPHGEGWYDADSLAIFSIAKYDSVSDSVRYRFLFWNGDTTGDFLVGIIKMNRPKKLNANFVEEFLVSVTCVPPTGGHVLPNLREFWVPINDQISLIAIPEENFNFLSWSGAVDTNDNPIKISINGPVRIVANFGSLLPINILEFRIQKRTPHSITLHWRTSSEVYNYGFFVERKSGEQAYVRVGFLPGKGTTTRTNDYYFTDNDVKSGSYRYRLHQVDVNGKSTFSEELTVKIKEDIKTMSIQNYPNPFNTMTTICLKSPQKIKADIKIYNLLGEEIYTFQITSFKKGMNYLTWTGKNNAGMQVPSGIYIMELKGIKYTLRKTMLLIE